MHVIEEDIKSLTISPSFEDAYLLFIADRALAQASGDLSQYREAVDKQYREATGIMTDLFQDLTALIGLNEWRSETAAFVDCMLCTMQEVSALYHLQLTY